MKKLVLTSVVVICALSGLPSAQQPPSSSGTADVVLLPTNHPRLPADISQLWMAPDRAHAHTAAMKEFSAGVALEVESNYVKALPTFSQPALQQGPLGHYAAYYKGLAELRLGRTSEARETFQALPAREPVGYLEEAAALREAECDEALGDARAAVQVYERLAAMKTTTPDDVLMRLGRAAKAAGDSDKALSAFSRVYFEFPFSDLSALASDELDHLPNVPPVTLGSTRYKLELGRAERLFGAKRYAQARGEFENIRRVADGDDEELVYIRLAECDYFLKRARNARDEVKPLHRQSVAAGRGALSSMPSPSASSASRRRIPPHRPPAGRTSSRIRPGPRRRSTTSPRTTSSTATTSSADADVPRDVRRNFRWATTPSARRGRSAGGRTRTPNYAETVRVFESAAAHFPRSDYRPSWLYWSARAHDALKRTDARRSALHGWSRPTISTRYYGRLARHAPGRRVVAQRRRRNRSTPTLRPPQRRTSHPLPPNEHVVRALLGLELYDQAIDELHYAQKVWGDSSAIQATIGWIYHRARRAAQRHQRDEARLPAVHGRRRREAAAPSC